ncbi:restriction endonuclease subunit S [Bacillus cereus]|uniref:restriction endonuclease subunit S n=1 Tax=Bacillus cereus TaxID=1396 RepID=UPI000BF56A34|nr:restriction endonuclease subunit S [Bacillus cereus]PFL28694.1 restriction endonuclease subunit S [Bacillus cereus]
MEIRYELKKCADIVDVRDGTHDSPKYVLSGYPLVTSKNIKNGKLDLENINYICTEDFEKINKRSKVDKGDIIMPMIGTVGNPLLVKTDEEFAIKNVALFKFQDNEIIFNRFFYYFLLSDLCKKQLSGSKRGGTQSFVSLKDLRDLKVPLPSFEQQKNMVAVLDKAQALIEKRKVAIAKLDELIQAVFIDMFGDPIKNPRSYEVVQLEELISFLTSGSRGWAKYFSKEGEFFITIKNVKSGQLQLGDITYVNAPIGKESERTKVKEGDLLISITADLGRTAVISEDVASKGAYINQHLSLIRLNQKCNPRYLSSYLESAGGKNQFESLNQIGVKSGLNFTAIKSLKIVLPPLEKQNGYDMIFREYLSKKEKMTRSLSMLETNFNSLLQRTFKGEMKINIEFTA